MISKKSKIYIAGHKGMVGSSIWKNLISNGYVNLIGKTRKELDLTNQQDVLNFFNDHEIDVVIDAAARVGGILANNNFPYEFLMENMKIQNNLIDAAFTSGIEKFVFLGSSCIYPKLSPQPIKEEFLLTNSLEKTNEWYAIAKITGVKACESIRKQYNKYYISLMPTNLYGYNDNFDLYSSHVLPAMLRKFHEAKEKKDSTVTLWGSGKPLREFLFVDDLAESVLFVLKNNLRDHIYNIGTGKEISIIKLAEVIKEIVGFEGRVEWDTSKPDGTPRKLLDTSKMSSLGWKYSTELKDGITKTYNWFLKNIDNIRK